MSKIKERLKNAYDQVTFYADRTWVNEFNSYQKANQELYARETKLRDLLMEETKRPRTVQDCIPKSKLAKYSNYEYNESRELSYAANTANISFYYPCTFKRDSIKEPWMLPEIEQLFIWLTYSCDFNLLDPIALEELNHLDEEENQNCCDDDFHQINPFFYKSMERAPGKPRYTAAPVLGSDEEILPSAWSLMKINSFEDMILRIKLKSENVQNCWARTNVPMKRRPATHPNAATAVTPNSEKGFNIFKSPFGNFFIFEDAKNIRNIPNLEKVEVLADDPVSENVHEIGDFSNLQDLTNSISSLQAWVLSASAKNVPVNTTIKPDKGGETADKNGESQPTKRLYSAVLQGLASSSVNISNNNNISTNVSNNIKISSLKSEQTNTTTTTTTTASSNYTHPAATMLQENCGSNNNGSGSNKQNISPRTLCSSTVFSEEPASSATKSGSLGMTQKVTVGSGAGGGGSAACGLWQNQYPWEPLAGAYYSNNNNSSSSSSNNNSNNNNSGSNKKGGVGFTAVEQVAKTSTPTLMSQNHILTATGPQSPTSAATTATDCWSKQTNSQGIACGGPYTTCPNALYSSSNITFSNSFNGNPYGVTHGFSNNFASANNYPLNLCPNNYVNSTYPNAAAISYSFSNSMYPNSQVSSGRNTPPLGRQAFAPPPINLNPPPSILLIQQHRATAATIYPFSHYAPAPHYLCLPTPPATRPSQRWQSSYVRPPSASSQSYHVPMTPQPPPTPPQQPQHWGLPSQHLYRTGSNHQFLPNTSQPVVYDNYDVSSSLNKLKQQNGGGARPKKAQPNVTATTTNATQYKNKNNRTTTLEFFTKDADFNDVLFDSYLKKTATAAAHKNCKCPSDVGISLQQQTEKTLLLKSSTSNSSLMDSNRFTRQASLSKLIFTPSSSTKKPQPHQPGSEGTAAVLEPGGGCEADRRLPLTSSLSEDLERQALEQYQPSNENFYQELERQAAEQCTDFPENWTRPPNNSADFFGGRQRGLRELFRCYCYVLLVLYVIDVRVCGCCLFAFS